jgi:hypothetical protein
MTIFIRKLFRRALNVTNSVAATVNHATPAPLPESLLELPAVGYVISVDRVRCEIRPNMGFARTIGVYQGYFNGCAIPRISGYCVERQGPGDNGQAGVENHYRIKEGIYPLFTHAGDNNHYMTIGYAQPAEVSNRPWPCLEIGNTEAKSGILIHCAEGYLMSIGCINLTSSISDASDDLNFRDSWHRTTDLINSISQSIGTSFPRTNNKQIPNSLIIIRGEPHLE